MPRQPKSPPDEALAAYRARPKRSWDAEKIAAEYRAKIEAAEAAEAARIAANGGTRYPWGDKWTWQEWKAWYKAAQAAANGEAPPGPLTSTHSRESRAGHTNAARSTRTPEELEEWAQAGIDDELDLVEADPPGTRNDALNSRALRCFRLALLAGYNLDDLHDALVDAARANKLIADDGINSVRGTLRSARTKAIEDGPAPLPRDLIHLVEVGAEIFDDEETT